MVDKKNVNLNMLGLAGLLSNCDLRHAQLASAQSVFAKCKGVYGVTSVFSVHLVLDKCETHKVCGRKTFQLLFYVLRGLKARNN